MSSPYTVALVLDPNFGDRLKVIAERIHTWVVDTPQTRAVAEETWAAQAMPIEYNIETGITTFIPASEDGPEAWCEGIVGTLDQHHDEMSHEPGYGVLEVYGLRFNERLRPVFVELGFSGFEETDYGFRAIKS